MESNKLYFPNLDGLRFVCFFLVFLHHSFFTLDSSILNTELFIFFKQVLSKNGNLGVNCFFVLSGFLITFLLFTEHQKHNKIDIPKFWLRRIFRIWPLFYFCVFFGFFIFPMIKKMSGAVPNETANLFYYMTFLNNFDFITQGLPDASILGVLWSVAIEEQFYFFWPILLSFIPAKKSYYLFISIIVVSLIFRYLNPEYLFHEYHSLSCIGDMAVGGLGAFLIIHLERFNQFIININNKAIILVYITFFLVYFFRMEIKNFNFMFNIFERIGIAFIFLFIILEQCYSKHSLFKFSNFKQITKLGKITYGLYCLHFLGILITLQLFKKLQIKDSLFSVLILQTLCAFLLSVIISKLSYRFFEMPFLKIKEKFSRI